MRIIAKAGNFEVTQDANSIVWLNEGNGTYIYDCASAYEGIRDHVKDPEVRAELLRQWSLDVALCNKVGRA